jgi:hypothetical protein
VDPADVHGTGQTRHSCAGRVVLPDRLANPAADSDCLTAKKFEARYRGIRLPVHGLVFLLGQPGLIECDEHAVLHVESRLTRHSQYLDARERISVPRACAADPARSQKE